MANTVKMKRSSVAGKVPATTDLELGELAVNTYDGKLFLKKLADGNESVVEVGLTSSHNHDASYPTLAAFNALVDRVAALEDALGDIQSALDAINGV